MEVAVGRNALLVERVSALESSSCDECFAVLTKTAATVREFGLATATRFGLGKYAAFFKRPVLECAYDATIGDDDATIPAMITVQGNSESPKVVLFIISCRLRSRTTAAARSR